MLYRLKKEVSRSVKGAVVLSALGLSALYALPASAAPTISLLETGSTLLYPLFNLWVPVYTKMNPGVQITTQAQAVAPVSLKRSLAWPRSAPLTPT